MKTEVVDLYLRVDAQQAFYRRAIDRIKYLQSDLEDMMSAINRHVDNVLSIEIVKEVESTCEFCGSRWTETSDTYNGGCCDEDYKNAPENAKELRLTE